MQDVQFKDGQLDAPMEQVFLGPQHDPAVVSVACDADGNLVGDISALPDNIVAQLQTPEARAALAKQHREYHKGDGPAAAPKPRYVNGGGRVDYTHLKPAHMGGKEFRQLRRAEFRRMRKAAVKIAGRIK